MRRSKKMRLASLLAWGRVSDKIFDFTGRQFFPYVRVINYHDTPESQRENFEEQIKYFLSRFVPVTLQDLEALFDGVWGHSKPGIILSFDDGLKNHFSVAAPTLEKYELKGLFFVPPGFVDEPEATAEEFCQRNQIVGSEALTIKEVEYLSKHHAVGSHSYNHVRLAEGLNPAEVEREVIRSRVRLEEMTCSEVVSFAWVGGENWSYGSGATSAIKSAGYKYAFAGNSLPTTASTDPYWIYRTNVEADWSIELVKMQLCGLADLWHWPNRISIRRSLARRAKF
mgnify:CR=1 FL=1